jgi:hypothetical protein
LILTVSPKDITTGVVLRPPRLLLFGVEGVGKTTFGSQAPAPIFLQTGEAGEGLLGFDRFTPEILHNFDAVIEALETVYADDKYKTVVFDTVQGLENIIWNEVCSDHDVPSIEDCGYGKGYVFALDYWNIILRALDDLRDHKGKTGKTVATMGRHYRVR